jgi:starch-binding outer membrane protein, SusD/RagB family
VESDLVDAQAALPDDYSDKDLGRATSGAATAYLGKALLYQQKWGDAASELAKIMDGRYALVDDFSWNFDETHEFNSESVFEITAETESGLGVVNLMANTFGMRPPYADRSIYTPTTWFLELFKEEKQSGGEYDKRLPLTFYFTDELNPGPWVYVDPSTGIGDTLAPDEIYYRKYCDFEQIPIATKAQNNLREMRYADVLLMYAEAMVEDNQLTAAATGALNEVRNRAGLENFVGSTQAELRDEIRKQRLLEFSLEGSRRNDLIRWGILESQMETIFGPGTPDEDEARYIYITQDDYIFPIPQREMDVNTKLIQNDGY